MTTKYSVFRAVKILYYTATFTGFSPYGITFGQDQIKITTKWYHIVPAIICIAALIACGILSIRFEETGSQFNVKFVLFAKLFMFRLSIILLVLIIILTYFLRHHVGIFINKLRSFDIKVSSI